MTTKKDITSQVDFGEVDAESLPLTQCACGQKFDPWDFILSIYEDMPDECPNCHRKLFFLNSIHVYEVVEDGTP